MQAMSRIVRIPVVAVVLLTVGSVAAFLILPPGPKETLVYAAPTLAALADDAATQMGGKVNVVVVGSAAAVRQVQMGAKPDVILSADAELANFLRNYRRIVDLGRFDLILVCSKPVELKDLGTATIGLADPNVSPIGNRAIAALYWLSVKSNLFNIKELENSLAVKFTPSPDGRAVTIDVTQVSASGRFKMREDLAAAFAMLENGAVDCVFASTPFAVSRNLIGRYHVLRLPEEVSFARDPPLQFRSVTTIGELEIGPLTALAVVFTERGERFAEVVLSLNLSKYGLVR